MAAVMAAAAAVALAIDQARRQQQATTAPGPVRPTQGPRRNGRPPAAEAAPVPEAKAAAPEAEAAPQTGTAPRRPGGAARRGRPQAPEAEAASTVSFYSSRNKTQVDVPLAQVRKRRVVRTGEDGVRRERFAAAAEIEVEGHPVKLFKFISRDQFEALDVPEED
jgi:hypothetical protein